MSIDMTTFVCIAKVSNAWVIYDSIRLDNKDALLELSKLIKNYNGSEDGNLFIYYDYENFKKLNESIIFLYLELEMYKISNNLFAVKENELTKIISNFLDSTIHLGLCHILPAENFIRKSTFRKCVEIIKKNKNKQDDEILKKYLPTIIQVRKLHSNPVVVKNITDLISRLYIDSPYKLKHSFFDSEGKRLINLYNTISEWYPLDNPGTSLMVAIGAFGFEDFNAILFLALDRIKFRLGDLEGKTDWREIDHMIPELINRKLDLLHLISWMVDKRLFKAKDLMQTIPLASIIPGDGMLLFEDSIDANLRFELDTYYQHVQYNLITN